MIINWPNAPAVTGELQKPKPFVYLIGDERNDWQPWVARQLEPHVGCVAYPGRVEAARGKGMIAFLQWHLFWMTEADTVGIWLGRSLVEGSDLEVGYLLGQASVARRAIPVVGHDGDDYSMLVLTTILQSLGCATDIQTSLEQFTHAIEASAKASSR